MANLNRLIGETDAQIWAEEFAKVVEENPDIPQDKETMRGWFANAIESGRRVGLQTYSYVGPHSPPEPIDHPVAAPPKPPDARRSVTPVWDTSEKVIGEGKLEISADGALIVIATITDKRTLDFLKNIAEDMNKESDG